MNTKRFLPLALGAALSASAFAATAQPVEPAVEPAPEQVDDAAVETVDKDLDVDRRCLEDTGSRVTADPQPATRKDHTEKDGHDCAMGPGTVHTRKDIDRTGATNLEDALRALDPGLR